VSVAAFAAGIYAVLNHASVTSLATGGVHRAKAPLGTAYPYVVFTPEPAPGLGDVLTGEAWLDMAWDVKVIDKSDSAAAADAAYAAVHARLQDATLSIAGHSLMYCRRRGLIAYDEDGEGGVTYQHVGGRYRIMAQAT